MKWMIYLRISWWFEYKTSLNFGHYSLLKLKSLFYHVRFSEVNEKSYKQINIIVWIDIYIYKENGYDHGVI